MNTALQKVLLTFASHMATCHFIQMTTGIDISIISSMVIKIMGMGQARNDLEYR